MKGLGQRDRGHLDRKPARLPHAALYLFRALAEVGVTLLDIAPRVDDRDHGLALVVGRARNPSDARGSDVPRIGSRRGRTSVGCGVLGASRRGICAAFYRKFSPRRGIGGRLKGGQAAQHQHKRAEHDDRRSSS